MTRDIALGQYFPGASFVHRMDPRVKLVLTIAFIVYVFVAQNFAGLLFLVAVTLGLMVGSGVPVKLYFKSMKGILLIVLFTAVLNLFYGTGPALIQIGILQITWNGICNAFFIAVRITGLMLFSSILTFTTSPTELTDAMERLLSPLKVLHIKVHELSMMMTIALRFVPTLLEETDKIMAAQKARGADMESGGLMQRVKAMVPVLIPLFVSSFRRAYDLATAMECRCYHGGEGRTKMKILHLGTSDYFALAFGAAVLAVILLVNHVFPPIA